MGYLVIVSVAFSVYDDTMKKDCISVCQSITNNERYLHFDSMKERDEAFRKMHMQYLEIVKKDGWYDIKNWPWVISIMDAGNYGNLMYFTMVPTSVVPRSNSIMKFYSQEEERSFVIGALQGAYDNITKRFQNNPTVSLDEMSKIKEKYKAVHNDLYFVQRNANPDKNLNSSEWIELGYADVKVETICTGAHQLTRIYTFEDTQTRFLLIGGLAILFTGIIIVSLSYSNYRSEREKVKSTLHYKLLQVCNPSNYFNPYNKEMIDKANLIYQEVLSTSPNDNIKLKELRSKVTKELGINFINGKELDEIKRLCDPSHFMNPYDPVKINKANEFYAKLSSNDLTIEEFEALRNKVLKLYNLN